MNALFNSLKTRSGPVVSSSRKAGFTLVEILVSLSVLTVLLLVSARVIGQVQSTWEQSNARVSQFREARTAFDILTRNLSQAALNTYIDYDQNYLTNISVAAAATLAPSTYLRKSDLQFRSGKASNLVGGGSQGSKVTGHAVFFQAPLGVAQQVGLIGLDRLMCGRGYFVQYTSDEFFRPAFLPQGSARYRYRLIEFSPPAEKNLIYARPPKPSDDNSADEWYSQSGADMTAENPENRSVNRPVADNILSLIISPQWETNIDSTMPKTGIAPYYAYNSVNLKSSDAVLPPTATQGTQHMLPPLVRVVIVAIDERSAERLALTTEGSAPPQGLPEALNKFQNAANLDKELEDLEEVLRQKRLNYRVFSSTIQLRGSKWSL